MWIRFTIYLNSVTDKHNPSRKAHNKSRPCVIFKQTGHDFNGCKVLQDHAFLRDAVIKSSLYFANEAKRRTAALTASMERERISLLNTISTINAMDSDSDSESEPRYLEESGDDKDDQDFL